MAALISYASRISKLRQSDYSMGRSDNKYTSSILIGASGGEKVSLIVLVKFVEKNTPVPAKEEPAV